VERETEGRLAVLTATEDAGEATASATQLTAMVKRLARAAGRDAVITDVQCPRACGADQVESDLYLIVAAEIAFSADHRGPFQQVAGAVGGSGVADVVVAGEH